MKTKYRIWLRNCCNFRKPEMESLSVSNIIIKEEPWVIITWRLSNGFKIKIKPSKKVYYGINSTVILKTSHPTKTIVIQYGNLWRSGKLIVPLTEVHFTDNVINALMPKKILYPIHLSVQTKQQHQRVLIPVALYKKQVSTITKACSIKLPSIKIKTPHYE